MHIQQEPDQVQQEWIFFIFDWNWI